MKVFISHSSKDYNIASEICEIIENGGNTCFIAPRDIRSGYEYAEEILNGLDSSDALLYLLSHAANQSPHVLREIERAVSKGIPIIVYKLEEVELTKSMEYFLMTHQWITDRSKGYDEILEAIKSMEDSGYKPVKVSSAKPVTKKSNKLVFVFGIVAILAIIIAIVAVFGTKNDSEKESDNSLKGAETTTKEAPSEKESEEDSTKESEEGSDSEDIVQADVKLGDEIELGTYNNEKIVWRVLKISDDGKEAVLISKNILSMKAYDAPDSGKYNYDGNKDYWSSKSEASTNLELQAKVRGNSDWSNSTIRAWLNADTEVVEYDGAPMDSAMPELANGYSNEPGFLNGFTDEELDALVETTITTKGNEISDKKEVETKDRVFLLSLDELEWFDDAGLSKLAKPTSISVEEDELKYYQLYSLDYNVEDYIWWLREPVEGSSSKCYAVGNGYTEQIIQEYIVAAEGFGIRPAITVDISKLPQ